MTIDPYPYHPHWRIIPHPFSRLQGIFQVAQHEATIADRCQGDLGVAAELGVRVDHSEAVVFHLWWCGLWMDDMVMFDDVSWFLEHQVFPEPKEPDWINSCSHWNRSQYETIQALQPEQCLDRCEGPPTASLNLEDHMGNLHLHGGLQWLTTYNDETNHMSPILGIWYIDWLRISMFMPTTMMIWCNEYIMQHDFTYLYNYHGECTDMERKGI